MINKIMIAGIFLIAIVNAQVEFSPYNIMDDNMHGYNGCFTIDADGDGDVDIVNIMPFTYYENRDGSGEFSAKKDLGFYLYRPVKSDLDNDGDMDMIGQYPRDNVIIWRENIGGTWEHHTIITLADKLNNLCIVDIDSDSDYDIVGYLQQDSVYVWYEHLDGSGIFNNQAKYILKTDPNTMIEFSDIDLDGDIDIAVCTRADITWHENVNGSFIIHELNGFPATEISMRCKLCKVIDIDQDADLDMVFVMHIQPAFDWQDYHKAFIYSHDAQSGQFILSQEFTIDLPYENFPDNPVLAMDDLDSDGDPDLICIAGTKWAVTWHENKDGRFNETESVISGDLPGFLTGPPSVYTDDIDADGDVDILLNGGSIGWFRNLDGLGDFGPFQGIDGFIQQPQLVRAFDIDQDGDQDLISASSWWRSGGLIWFENYDSNGLFSGGRPISGLGIRRTYDLETGDMDKDGYKDIILAGSNILWLRNENEHFHEEHVITEDYAESIAVIDLDLDGDLDVIAGSVWYENADGTGNDWIRHGTEMQVYHFTLGDINEDTYPDVVLLMGQYPDYSVEWVENVQGSLDFSSRNLIDNKSGAQIHLADMNGDDALDIIVFHSSSLLLYENLNGQGEFGPARVIMDSFYVDHFSTADLDLDGDQDIMACGFSSHSWRDSDDWCSIEGGGSIFWAENLDGRSRHFSQRHYLPAWGGDFVTSAHLNEDTYPDILFCLGEFNHCDSEYGADAHFEASSIDWFMNSGPQPNNRRPVALNDTLTLLADNTQDLHVLDNDFDPDNDVISIQSINTTGIRGTIQFNPPAQTLLYTPPAPGWDADSFLYVISDVQGESDTARVVLLEPVPNHKPVAVNDTVIMPDYEIVQIQVLANDSDPDGDSVQVVNIDTSETSGTVEWTEGDAILTYTPAINFSGMDHFLYTITDNKGKFDTASVTICIPHMNQPPVAVDDSVTVTADSAVIIRPLLNDYDPDGNSLKIVKCGNSANFRILSIASGDTALIILTSESFSGTEKIDYVISDGQGGLDTASVYITVEMAAGVDERSQIPSRFALQQNHPNPFNPSTTIRYDLPHTGLVSICVYDMLGREIETLVQQVQSPGTYQVSWDGSGFASGIYLIRMQAGDFRKEMKMILIK